MEAATILTKEHMIAERFMARTGLTDEDLDWIWQNAMDFLGEVQSQGALPIQAAWVCLFALISVSVQSNMPRRNLSGLVQENADDVYTMAQYVFEKMAKAADSGALAEAIARA